MKSYLSATRLMIIAGLLFLLFGLLCGVLGGLQYITTDFLSGSLPFYKLRPLHVFSVTAFIILSATGSVYYYLNDLHSLSSSVSKKAVLQSYIFTATSLIIIALFIAGVFGGREYLEYPPQLALPIILFWVLFGWNYLKIVNPINFSKAPVYYWMWGTGIVFFFITYLESYLWLFPFFRDNIVRDVTVQWKSLGSMVGAWNMLIYGSAFYLMEKISGNKETARKPLTFFFYFLGFTNLMFNWGHHTYIVPSSPWIRITAYAISMTELLIVGNIILGWRKTVTEGQKNFHNISCKLLTAADLWMFLNLLLAIIISVPAINQYTHGTHITVAHAMGTTIGINTTILLASLYFIATQKDNNLYAHNKKMIDAGYWLTNISLFIFWTSLITAGYIKGKETIAFSNENFRDIMEHIRPILEAFSISGIGVAIGIFLMAYPLLKSFITSPKAA